MAFLPETVSVRWFKEVSDDFHARFSAMPTAVIVPLSTTVRSAHVHIKPGRDEPTLHHLIMKLCTKAAQYLVVKQRF